MQIHASEPTAAAQRRWLSLCSYSRNLRRNVTRGDAHGVSIGTAVGTAKLVAVCADDIATLIARGPIAGELGDPDEWGCRSCATPVTEVAAAAGSKIFARDAVECAEAAPSVVPITSGAVELFSEGAV